MLISAVPALQVLAGLQGQKALLAEEICDCTINYFLEEKSSGLNSFEDFFCAVSRRQLPPIK